MLNSPGRYWDRPWSLVDGCTPCSPGCEHCWSMAMGKRFHRWPEKVTIRPEHLDIPLRTRKPTVFSLWNDLFHEDVSDSFRDDALAVMALRPQHTFLLLSKRANGMAAYWNYKDGTINRRGRIQNQINFILAMNRLHYDRNVSWPLPHVYLGVTVCNQQEADAKIPELLKVPGKKFISYEPALGPVDFRPFLGFWQWSRSENFQTWVPHDPSPIDLVICGGETGPGARPMHPDWPRSVRDQCQAAGVPFFFKQWGEWIPFGQAGIYFAKQTGCGTGRYWLNDDESKSFQQTFPDSFRVGSKRAGRTLDGKEHNELPWEAK